MARPSASLIATSYWKMLTPRVLRFVRKWFVRTFTGRPLVPVVIDRTMNGNKSIRNWFQRHDQRHPRPKDVPSAGRMGNVMASAASDRLTACSMQERGQRPS